MGTQDTPIIVNDTVLPGTLAALLRYVFALGVAYLVGRGILPEDSAEGVITLALSAAAVGYGLWKTHQRKKDLITAAKAAPSSVAVVR